MYQNYKNEIILAKVTNNLVAIRCLLVLLNFFVMFKVLIPSLLDILPSLQFLNITLRVSRIHLSVSFALFSVFYLNIGASKDFLQNMASLSTSSMCLVSTYYLKAKDSQSMSSFFLSTISV